MFGLFGVMAYVFPVILFASVIFGKLNEGVQGIKLRQAALWVLFLDAMVFAHLVLAQSDVTVSELYGICSEQHNWGGLIGGIIGIGLMKAIDIGAFLVVFIVAVISIVIFSEKTIINGYKNYMDSTFDDRMRMREERARIRDEQNRIRNEHNQMRKDRARARKQREEENIDWGNIHITGMSEQPVKEPEPNAEKGPQIQFSGMPKGRKNAASGKKVSRGVDFVETDIVPDSSNSEIPASKVGKIREITIEGLEPSYSGHVNISEEESGQYTYIEPENHRSNRKEQNSSQKGQKLSGVIDIDLTGQTQQEEDHSTDGEFSPKERIFVPEEAKKAMKRNPYQTQAVEPVASVAESTNDMMATGNGAVSNTVKNTSNANASGATTGDDAQFKPKAKKKMRYIRPKVDLLNKNPGSFGGTTKEELMETAEKLQLILKQFGVNVTVTNVSKGPSVTRYELQPEIGTKVSKITSLTDDIKLNLAASDIRIEAPIPGKAAVGIEVPNKKRDSVYIRELIESKELRESKSKIAFAAGKDIAGRVVVADIAKMPHMLVAGTTGSGKSVFTNSIIMSILYRATPDEVKLIIIDPKVVEFGIYNGIPHLMAPVVTDPKKAAGALNWAVAEMSDRYKKFAATGTRDLKGYNDKIEAGDYQGDEKPDKLPQIVIIIDELADLMMVAAKDVEDAICRLAQLARAAGIHLIIATQRPSVDVVTGLIKANIPSRVALLVSSGTDSRTIIDSNGAEKLLGNGDMLFYPSGYAKPVRLQGAFVSDEEVQKTVEFLIENSGEVDYDESFEEKINAQTEETAGSEDNGTDAFFIDAARLVVEKQKGSTSMIQRTFRVGFNRAARIMEQLYEAGIVGQEETNKPRRVLITLEEFELKYGSGSGNNNV
ncbi:MAG: DNA translocase FtsK [Lachnospiraceae bacterium]|nr:DNA translocase FtsK [Lachnospiraceae bacterium]